MQNLQKTSNQSLSVALYGLIRLVRPKQWIKNGFVLIPLLFTAQFLQVPSVVAALMAALLFTIASAATYILNDIKDIEKDRSHPVKSKSRPLAANIISVPVAASLLAVLLMVLAASFLYYPAIGKVIFLYLALNFAYSFFLKNQPVIDIFVIASGFVLRVWAGAEALAVPLSGWMFVTTLSLALYLAAVKRRQELALVGSASRKVLEKYSTALFDRYAEMSAMSALVFYALFVITEKPQLIVSIPLVLFGLFRYWYIVEVLEGGESPTDALFSDYQLMICVAIWGAVCVWALWPGAV